MRACSKDMRKHMRSHLPETNYFCEVCQKTFKTLIDAQTHSQKPCGNIKQREVVIDIEDGETHSCNACSTSFDSNNELEEHMEKHHATDCSKYHATFKSQEDVYKHANDCSEVVGPFLCDMCNRELISSSGLKKHMDRCKGYEMPAKKSKEECWNGAECKFLKYNRCSYSHPEKPTSEEPWKTVQGRRSKKRRSDQILPCNNCKEKFKSPREKQNHKCRQHDVNRRDHIQPRERKMKKDIECSRGPNCFRLANTLLF